LLNFFLFKISSPFLFCFFLLRKYNPPTLLLQPFFTNLLRKYNPPTLLLQPFLLNIFAGLSNFKGSRGSLYTQGDLYLN
jgi:hypothetical protein